MTCVQRRLLFCVVLLPHYQFLSFAHSYHCLPSCSFKSLACLSALIKIASFLAFIFLSFFPPSKAVNGDAVLLFSQELWIKRGTKCEGILQHEWHSHVRLHFCCWLIHFVIDWCTLCLCEHNLPKPLSNILVVLLRSSRADHDRLMTHSLCVCASYQTERERERALPVCSLCVCGLVWFNPSALCAVRSYCSCKWTSTLCWWCVSLRQRTATANKNKAQT